MFYIDLNNNRNLHFRAHYICYPFDRLPFLIEELIKLFFPLDWVCFGKKFKPLPLIFIV